MISHHTTGVPLVTIDCPGAFDQAQHSPGPTNTIFSIFLSVQFFIFKNQKVFERNNISKRRGILKEYDEVAAR